MRIKLNGETRETAARTVADLLAELQAPKQGVAVAVNEQVVRRTAQDITELQDGDEVELIRAVQGG